MTNVGHMILFKLAKTNTGRHLTCRSLKICSRLIGCVVTCNLQHSCERSSLGEDLIRRSSIQRRFSSNTSHGHNPGEGGTRVGDQDASSTHQRYHRQSYERRRSDNAKRSQEKQSDRFNGSQPAEQMSHYQRLNIEQDADPDTIKSAYYSLSKVYHPDIVGNDDAEAVDNFRLITESYDTLKDAQLKAEYDHQLDQATKEVPLNGMMQSGGRGSDMSTMFRSRNADLIFKARQEAALQREKLLYPKKFRAGAFKHLTIDQVSASEQVARLDKHLSQLNSRSRGMDSSSSDFFYRQHLVDTILRRKSSIEYSREFISDDPDKHSDSATMVSFVGMLSILVIVLLLIFVETDFAAKLDEKYDQSRGQQVTDDKQGGS